MIFQEYRHKFQNLIYKKLMIINNEILKRFHSTNY